MARRKDNVLRGGSVTVESGGKTYTVKYEVLKGGVVSLPQTNQATQLGGMSAEQVARMLLVHSINSGDADARGFRASDEVSRRGLGSG